MRFGHFWRYLGLALGLNAGMSAALMAAGYVIYGHWAWIVPALLFAIGMPAFVVRGASEASVLREAESSPAEGWQEQDLGPLLRRSARWNGVVALSLAVLLIAPLAYGVSGKVTFVLVTCGLYLMVSAIVFWETRRNLVGRFRAMKAGDFANDDAAPSE